MATQTPAPDKLQDPVQPSATVGSMASRAPIPYREFIAICASLMASTALAIDIVLPAMLVIGAALGSIDGNSAQWIVTAYVVPYACGQLLFGPLSDRFGRRNILMVGMTVYALGALASVFATSFTALLIGRAVAGFGAASGRVASVALVRDCFAGRDMASIMSIIMMVFMVIPILAPALGQVMVDFANWQAIFVFMALFGFALVAWVALRLPETLAPENRNPLTAASITNAFSIVITQRSSIAYALAMATFFGSLFGFINSAPQIFLGIYELGSWFPVAFSAGAGFIALSSLINSRIVHRIGMRRLSHTALAGFILCGLALTAVAALYGGRPPMLVFTAATAMMFFFFGFIGTNFNALAMEPLGHHAGMASAVFGFLQMGVAGVLGALIGQLFDGTTIPLLLGFSLCGCISLGLVFWGERGKLFGIGTDYK
ncbi:MAG: multidrug effflux MFS transporter [Pseudomonadota bacterium]